jgi:hypothetical protein
VSCNPFLDMSEIKVIQARHPDGTKEECSVEISNGPDWKRLFSGVGLENRLFTGNDLFAAFISLRRALEESGIKLLCAGFRPDVYPSGMSRSMGGGRKAYVTKLGQPARSAPVDIFDFSDAELIGSVSEQQAFHDQWVASLQK